MWSPIYFQPSRCKMACPGGKMLMDTWISWRWETRRREVFPLLCFLAILGGGAEDGLGFLLREYLHVHVWRKNFRILELFLSFFHLHVWYTCVHNEGKRQTINLFPRLGSNHKIATFIYYCCEYSLSDQLCFSLITQWRIKEPIIVPDKFHLFAMPQPSSFAQRFFFENWEKTMHMKNSDRVLLM